MPDQHTLEPLSRILAGRNTRRSPPHSENARFRRLSVCRVRAPARDHVAASGVRKRGNRGLLRVLSRDFAPLLRLHVLFGENELVARALVAICDTISRVRRISGVRCMIIRVECSGSAGVFVVVVVRQFSRHPVVVLCSFVILLSCPSGTGTRKAAGPRHRASAGT